MKRQVHDIGSKRGKRIRSIIYRIDDLIYSGPIIKTERETEP